MAIKERKLKDGEVILAEGTPNERVYKLEEGEVVLFRGTDKERVHMLMPNEIVIAAGLPQEKLHKLKIPVGKSGRKKTAKLLPLMSGLEHLERNQTIEGIGKMVNDLWDQETFEEEMLPFVLNMEDGEGQAYLETIDLMTALEAFIEGAMFIIGGAGSNKQFGVALKK